mgnify:CR=1 FL=1
MKKIFLLFTLILNINFSFAQTLSDSLIAHYTFDGNANDITGNGNDGTVNGATLTTDRFGNLSAYHFNGSSDYISYHHSSNFQPGTFPITVTAWIKCNSNSFAAVFGNDFTPDAYTGFLMQVNVSGGQGYLSVGYGDGTASATTPAHRRTKFGTSDVNDNQWHFVAMVIRGPADMNIWVDCADDGGNYSGTGGPLGYAGNDGNSGKSDVLAGTYWYGGDIDDIRFYHRELNSSELTTLMQTPSVFFQTSVYLGPDVTLCAGNSVTLSPAGYSSYLWSTGQTTSSITIDSTGTGLGTVNVSLTAAEAHGCEATDNINITFIDCSVENGIENTNAGNEITVYANTASNELLVKGTSLRGCEIEIFNALGQRLMNEKAVEETVALNISNLSSGIFFLRTTSANYIHSLQQFVVSR